MSIAKVIEISAESNEGYDAAVHAGVQEASKTVKNIRNAWVKDHEVVVGPDDTHTHRVDLKVTFVIDEGQRA